MTKRQDLSKLRRQPSNLPEKQQSQSDTNQVVAARYEGPLPPPGILAGYDEIVPGSAAKIIERFLEQGTHRMQLEKVVVHGGNKRANWGIVAGFVIAMTTIVGAIYAMSLGYDVAGTAVVIASLASLVGTFLYGTKSRREERSDKS